MSTRIIGFAALLCALVFAGCNRQASTPNYLVKDLKEKSNSLSPSYNAFGFRLLRDLSAKKGENILISPHSIATVLAMVNNGARGQTQIEINNVLETGSLSLQQLNDANAVLKEDLSFKNSPTTLNIANAVWTQQGKEFEQQFLDDTKQCFDAEIGQLNFKTPQAVQTVNNWVNTKTSGMIPTLVQEFPPATMMVLVNAVYFKGKWQTPFKPSSTQEQDFHLQDGETKRLPMMSQGGRFQYFIEGKDNKQLEAVALPYNDGRLNLYLFLPGPKQSLDFLVPQFNTENWQRWIKQFSQQSGSVSLPRFKMSYATQLGEALQKLGVKQLFQLDKADLSSIRKSNDLFISQVIHKTVMEVNEEGTKAAAVTGAMAAGGAAPVGPPPFQFVADRPFLVVLHDSQTDAILFIGAVRSPE